MLSQLYAHALPYALLSASPPLAALHATRSHLPHHHFCPRCGHHSALHSTTVRRTTRPAPASHALTSVCNICGHVSHLHFDRPHTSSSFPSAKNRTRWPTHPVKAQPPIELQKPAHPKPPKHKKKPGLAELLQRNRQKQSDSSQQPLSTALSAFLTTL